MFGYLYNNDDQLAQQNIIIQQELEQFVGKALSNAILITVEIEEVQQPQIGFQITYDADQPIFTQSMLPIVQIDYDQQPQGRLQQWEVKYDDVDSVVIWPIPIFSAPAQRLTPMASSYSISKAPRSWIPRAAMMETAPVELIQYPPGVISRGWDTDADQQKQQDLGFQADSQQEREFTNFLIIPEILDNDAENQKFQLPYQIELQADDNVEKITIPPPLVDFTWDNDAENQLLQAGWFQDSWEGSEVIKLFPVVVQVFILGTGTAIQTVSASGSATPMGGGGTIQPLINAAGDLLP